MPKVGENLALRQMPERKTCFLIDDDLDDQLIFSLALKQVNHLIRCVTADTGVEALKKLEQFNPDYIFLDLNMPGMNGIECLLKIKKLIPLSKIPVAIYTTSSNQKHIVETSALGARAFINKPYHVSELSKKLEDFFSMLKIQKSN